MKQNQAIGKIGNWARENTNLLMLLIMLLLGAILTANFFTVDNLMNLLRRITINGVMAAGKMVFFESANGHFYVMNGDGTNPVDLSQSK